MKRRALPSAFLVAAMLVMTGCTGGHDGPATDVTASKATLNGSVSSAPPGDTTYWFEYGTTTGYGSETTHKTIAISDFDSHAVAERITGLTAGTQYHFRTCASGGGDAPICSSDRSFTTDGGGVELDANPSLYPAFNSGVSDYVTRCTSGTPVNFSGTAGAGITVAIGGQAGQTGSFNRDVFLSPGEATTVVTVKGTTISAYHVRCLPSDFPLWSYSRDGASDLAFTLVTPTPNHYVAFFNTDGVPVWWYRDPGTPFDAKVLPDGNLAWGHYPTGDYDIRKLDGTLVRTEHTVGTPTDFHELQRLSNGDDVLVSYKPRNGVDLSPYGGPANAQVLDAEIQEITPSGTVVWSWNSKDHIGLAETGRWYPQVIQTGTPFDIAHINAVEPDGDGFLISLRHTDAVYRIAKSDGSVQWKLGGTPTPQSLTVSGDPVTPHLGGQHDVRRQPDGTITLHDNGTGLGRAPRALRFSVDTTTKTATLVQRIADPAIPSSFCCGSARRLPGGHWLINWGGVATAGEYGADGHVISKLNLGSFFSYRAFPVLPGVVTAAQLRAAMDTMATSAPVATARAKRTTAAQAQSAAPVEQAAKRVAKRAAKRAARHR